jgi:hypothetical protein
MHKFHGVFINFQGLENVLKLFSEGSGILHSYHSLNRSQKHDPKGIAVL